MEHLHLGPGNLLRIRDGCGMVVHVWSGGIWLTEEGDNADRFIGPGGWFRISSRGVTLISALGRRASVVLSAKERAEPLRARLAKLWVGLFAPAARPTTAGL